MKKKIATRVAMAYKALTASDVIILYSKEESICSLGDTDKDFAFGFAFVDIARQIGFLINIVRVPNGCPSEKEVRKMIKLNLKNKK